MSLSNQNHNIPGHIAIIMDGNGRWAKKHRLPRIEGHRKGSAAVRTIVEACIELGISYLTLYVFSTENWNRPASEVEGLFSLLKENLEDGISIAMEKGVKLYHLGKTEGLPESITDKIAEAVETTSSNRNLNLILAFNYGGRDEIVNAVRQIAEQGMKPEEITESVVSGNLYLPGIPDPDLIIRTAGEMRLSNFLLWQAAYAEIYFSSVLWPDFDKKELKKAIAAYGKRQRRFGGLPAENVQS